MSRRGLAVALTVALGACVSAPEPCPAGMVMDRNQDRCVMKTEPVEGHNPDATVSPEAGTEEPMDAGMDANASEGGAGDAGADASNRPDGGDDAGNGDASPEAQCFASDVQLWASFHVQPGLVQTVQQCVAAAACDGGICALDQCIVDAASLSSCNSCVAAEVQCVALNCEVACGSKGSDESCRACACAHGCTTAFDQCSKGSPLDVCADCDGVTCTNQSIDPALIMVVVQPLLLPV